MSQVKSLQLPVAKDAAKLGGMVLICLLLLYFVYQQNKAQIENTETAYFTQQLEKVIKGVDYDNELLASKTTFTNFSGYYACQNGKVQRYIAEISTNQGYNGLITLLVAVDNKQITDSEVVFHRETPGLGDLIERGKSDWLTNFSQPLAQIESESNLFKLKQYGGQIDSLAGATITSNAVSERLQQFVRNDLAVLIRNTNCQTSNGVDNAN